MCKINVRKLLLHIALEEKKSIFKCNISKRKRRKAFKKVYLLIKNISLGDQSFEYNFKPCNEKPFVYSNFIVYVSVFVFIKYVSISYYFPGKTSLLQIFRNNFFFFFFDECESLPNLETLFYPLA